MQITLQKQKILSLYVLLIYIFLVNFNLLAKQEKFIIIAIHKTGTHLTKKAIELILKEASIDLKLHGQHWDQGSIKEKIINERRTQLIGHALYNPKSAKIIRENNYKGFFCIRDPRDVTVSLAFYSKTAEFVGPNLSELSLDQQLTYLLNTEKKYQVFSKDNAFFCDIPNVKSLYNLQTGWGKEKNFFIIKFEDLIGPKGNGSLQKQLKTIKAIAQHININLSNKQILNISNNLFGNTETFRKGQIGDWKNHFSQKHKLLAKKTLGKILIDLGYENDKNW